MHTASIPPSQLVIIGGHGRLPHGRATGGCPGGRRLCSGGARGGFEPEQRAARSDSVLLRTCTATPAHPDFDPASAIAGVRQPDQPRSFCGGRLCKGGGAGEDRPGFDAQFRGETNCRRHPPSRFLHSDIHSYYCYLNTFSTYLYFLCTLIHTLS